MPIGTENEGKVREDLSGVVDPATLHLNSRRGLARSQCDFCRGTGPNRIRAIRGNWHKRERNQTKGKCRRAKEYFNREGHPPYTGLEVSPTNRSEPLPDGNTQYYPS